jgi:BlaI family transcriptional regulator, penicillinase repressor
MEILKVVWQKEPVPVREVHETLRRARPVALTTVASMMQLMEEKGLLALVSPVRPFRYRAGIDVNAARDALLAELVQRAFDGSPRQMIRHFLASHKVPVEQIDQVDKSLNGAG